MKINITSGTQLKTHLKSLRNAKGWTQIMLADKLGLSQSRIVQIESNPESVSVDQLIHILNTLGAKLIIDVNDLKINAKQPVINTKSLTALKGIKIEKLSDANKKAKAASKLSELMAKKSKVKW